MGRWERLGNEGLVQVSIEVFAEIGWQPVDVAGELEQWIVDGLPHQRANGDTDGL